MSSQRSTEGFLAGGGEMGERMRALDWSTTPLGPPEGWPQSLRTAIGMMLPSKAQICFFWGPEFVVVYNDAYRPVFGGKHPRMLGQPGRVAWSEIWDTSANLHELLSGVVRTGEAFSGKDLLFFLERHGFVEETYFDVSYDPVRVESGAVGGVYCIVSETTGRVVGERRLALLRDLAAQNASARSPREACGLAMEALAMRPLDIRFALAYLDGELQACTPGAEAALAAAPPELVKELPIGPGRLVVGINPERPFDVQHRSFLDLVAGQLATTIANAEAYEEERKRALALAELDRAKTTFFSNVSHEFRTPLTLMLGPVEDALADVAEPLSPRQRERQEVVRRNALRLHKMVNSLLDFARIEAGRIQAAYEPTDLAEYTAELASTFRSAIEKAGMRLVVDAPRLAEPVYVDRDMWEKIVLNLLSNAFKFTLEGEIRVSLRSTDRAVELDVRDTGCGVPIDELPHLFERFHRVEGNRGRTQEGTGIGLALVQELVRLHGGEISVASDPGRGSAFRVRIPLGTEHLPEEAIGRSPKPAARIGAASFVEEALRWIPEKAPVQGGDELPAAPIAPARARVLVADDNSDMRDYLTRLLEQHYEVEPVADGAAALAAARARTPDLVLSDVMMPVLDGFGLVEALRRDPDTRALPIVLLSARAGEEARIEGVQAGADDYLVKPFSARELLARVGAHVEMSRLRRAAAERERALREEAEAARLEAEDANRAKAAFLATMSHELRTPLNAILGYADLLESAIAGPVTDGQRKQLNRIVLSAQHLLRIIEEILSFSRIEAGHEEVRTETVDVAEVVGETAALMEPLANAKGLGFTFRAQGQALTETDPSKVRQIVFNLVSNAVKFTETGSVHVDLTADGDHYLLRVEDTGIGIAQEHWERIFEPFSQIKDPTRPYGGTGLGLSVTRQLARLLGGDASVTSSPGQGSAFSVRLPVRGASSQPD
jgi:signal transduction histidine kinase